MAEKKHEAASARSGRPWDGPELFGNFGARSQETLSQPLPGNSGSMPEQRAKRGFWPRAAHRRQRLPILKRQQERAVRETTNITDSG